MPVRVSYRSNQVHPCWGDPCPHSSHFASPKNVFRGRTMAFCGCYVPKWRGEKSIPNVGVSWIEWLKILLFFCGGLDISVVELLTRTVYCCRNSQRNRSKISWFWWFNSGTFTVHIYWCGYFSVYIFVLIASQSRRRLFKIPCCKIMYFRFFSGNCFLNCFYVKYEGRMNQGQIEAFIFA